MLYSHPLSSLRYVTLHFRDRRDEVLIRYRSEIAPKSSFLCVNSSLRKPAAKSEEKRMFSQAMWTKALSEYGFPVPLQKLSVIMWTWPKTPYLVHEPLEPGSQLKAGVTCNLHFTLLKSGCLVLSTSLSWSLEAAIKNKPKRKLTILVGYLRLSGVVGCFDLCNFEIIKQWDLVEIKVKIDCRVWCFAFETWYYYSPNGDEHLSYYWRSELVCFRRVRRTLLSSALIEIVQK